MNVVAKAWGLPEDDPAMLEARRQVALHTQFRDTTIVAMDTETRGSIIAVHFVLADGGTVTVMCDPAAHRERMRVRHNARMEAAALLLDQLDEVDS